MFELERLYSIGGHNYRGPIYNWGLIDWFLFSENYLEIVSSNHMALTILTYLLTYYSYLKKKQ